MQSGQKARDYVFEEKIDAGGMGEVWRALHTVLQRRVAIKVMDPHLASDPEFEQRFIQEARAQAALHHPRILQVTDFFSEGGIYYLVMPLVDGVSLEARLTQSQGPLGLEEAVKIAHDVLEGLDYAHQRRIIHRDVKPSNILLDASGHACLLDFGIALMIGQDRHTRTGASLGTPDYMSPEQILRPKTIDHRADVYSAACVIYEMLGGRPPFGFSDEQGGTAFVVQQAHVTQTPDPVRKWNPAVPPGLDAVILRALAKDPDQRWNGCGEFLRALEGRRGDTLLEKLERPLSPPPPSPPPPVQPMPAPSPAPTPGPQPSRAPTPEPLPSPTPVPAPLPVPPPKRKGSSSWAVGAVFGGLALVAVLVMVNNRDSQKEKAPSQEPSSAAQGGSFQTPKQPAPQPSPSSSESETTNVVPSSGETENNLSADFSKVFRGKVGRFQVELQLTRNGEELRGSYLNPPRNRDTALVGTVDSQGKFTIDEYQRGEKHTGVYRGRFLASSRLEMQGTWSKPEGGPLSMHFELREAQD